MVRATEDRGNRRCLLPRTAKAGRRVALVCLAFGMLLAASGCAAAGSVSGAPKGSAAATGPVGANMAGPAQQVIVSRAALDARPHPWVLTTPENAVRSYLDWISYGYRIGDSTVTTATMSAAQEVHVDSYIQLNLESSRLIDQTLTSITFGKQSVEGTHTLVPAKEHWTYRYVSTKAVNQTLSGPFSASYDTTYTVVKTAGGWVVDSVAAKALGEVK